MTQRTLLHDACDFNAVAIVKYLLTKNVNVNAKEELGDTPLHRVIRMKADVTLIRLLKTNGAKLNLENVHEKATPIHLAALMGNQSAIQEIICLGVNQNAKWKITLSGQKRAMTHAQITAAIGRGTIIIDTPDYRKLVQQASNEVSPKKELIARYYQAIFQPILDKRLFHLILERFFPEGGDWVIKMDPSKVVLLASSYILSRPFSLEDFYSFILQKVDEQRFLLEDGYLPLIVLLRFLLLSKMLSKQMLSYKKV